MSFNIGHQTGGVINNVAGNQHVAGDQRGSAVSMASVQEAVRDLRGVLEHLDYDSEAKASAIAELDGIEKELRALNPDSSRVGTALDKLAAILLSAGAVATAGLSWSDRSRPLRPGSAHGGRQWHSSLHDSD